MKSSGQPLSKAQLDLLKLFPNDIDDKDVKEIKKIIVTYLSEKLAKTANKVWDEKGWTNEDMDRLLNTHKRTPYKGKF